MLARAEDGDADPFEIADHEVWVMPRHPDMGKAGQVGIGHRDALHRSGEVPEARAKDQAQVDGRRTGTAANNL